MAKAINWPAEFRDEVLAEDTGTLRCALRPGDLYYVNRYWAPDEVVDIRVNHKKIRKAKIVGDLKLCRLDALTDADRSALKSMLGTIDQLIDFLGRAYPQSGPFTDSSMVTVVYYRNLPVVPEEVEEADDPHM